MGWVTDVIRFRHDMFIAFIECKINDRGNWRNDTAYGDQSGHEVLRANDNSEFNTIQVIEPDGLRRTFRFNQGASISMYQNVLSYQSGYVEEIIVDEKAQAGKGKNRDILQ